MPGPELHLEEGQEQFRRPAPKDLGHCARLNQAPPVAQSDQNTLSPIRTPPS